MADRPCLRVSFYVQHLLGIGHLMRSLRVAEALQGDGWDVELMVGGDLPQGMATGDLRLLRLPPVRAPAGELSTLVHPDGRAFSAADQAERRDLLLAHVTRHRPDVLLIEAFPFGRRQMRFELLPLLQQVRGWPRPPLVAASVRDILQEHRRPERVAETVATIARFFDHVLVHGDPTLARLEDSFPAAGSFSEKISYTGLVGPTPRTHSAGPFDVVVSAGGGAVGATLLATALAARSLSRARTRRWLFVAGPNLPADALEALVAREPGVTVERFRPDLATVLAGAQLSISQAGYNTVADLLAAGCRAVLVPYAQEGETEQALRARLLARAGRAVVVSEADLDAKALAAAVDDALSRPPHGPMPLDGASRTASLLRSFLVRRISA